MTPVILLSELRARGITLTANGDKLAVNAPRGALTPELKAKLTERKAAILALLQDPQAEALAILDAWRDDPRPDNATWARRYAEAATKAGLPFYDDGVTDLGANGWQEWTVNLGTAYSGEYNEAMAGLAVIHSEWPIDSPNPIVYAVRAAEATTETKPENDKRQTTIFEQPQIQKPKTGEEKMKLNDVYPSQYLKAEELDSDLVVTIDSIEVVTFKSQDPKKGDEQKPVCYFKGDEAKPLILNRTNWKSIASQWGDESDDWVGKRITLTVSQVDAFGKSVQAIRIKQPRSTAKPAPAKKPLPVAATVAEPDPFDIAMNGGDGPDEEPPEEEVI